MMDTHPASGKSAYSRAILLACTGLVLGRAQAAEHIVLETNSARYVAGEALDSAAALSLGNEEFLVLASEDGILRRIEGPYAGFPAGAGEQPSESSIRRAIAQLLGASYAEPGRLGGTRGSESTGTAKDTRPEPWLIHAEQSGDQCVLRDGAIEFWRERVDGDLRAEVVEATSGQSAELQWVGSEARADWPFAAAPADNGIYLVRPVDEVISVPIRLHALAPELADQRLPTVAWLAARGCVQQAQIMLRDLPKG